VSAGTVTATAWTVEGSGGRKLRVDTSDDRSLVTWLCGGQRSFDKERLQETIEYVARLERLGPDVWFTHADANGRRFSLRLEGDQLYAGDTPTSFEDIHVPWSAVRELLAPAPRRSSEEDGFMVNPSHTSLWSALRSWLRSLFH
jgi:hypothetical protein